MKFSDKGLILSQRKYGEGSFIIKLLSSDNGICHGFVKKTKNRENLQIGNLVSFDFYSRSEESLGGFYRIEVLKSYCAKIIFDRLKLDCASSLFALINCAFLERERQNELFDGLCHFLQIMILAQNEDKRFLANYINLELRILAMTGYGVDLSSCVVTNSTKNLAFVSPKSSRAVSYHTGKPFANKLFKLPEFLINDKALIEKSDLVDGLKLSGFFLDRFLKNNQNSENKNFTHYRNNILSQI